MSGWPDAWGLPWTSPQARMEWMGMSVDGLMPGMATPSKWPRCGAAGGEAADVLFLQLMILITSPASPWLNRGRPRTTGAGAAAGPVAWQTPRRWRSTTCTAADGQRRAPCARRHGDGHGYGNGSLT